MPREAHTSHYVSLLSVSPSHRPTSSVRLQRQTRAHRPPEPSTTAPPGASVRVLLPLLTARLARLALLPLLAPLLVVVVAPAAIPLPVLVAVATDLVRARARARAGAGARTRARARARARARVRRCRMRDHEVFVTLALAPGRRRLTRLRRGLLPRGLLGSRLPTAILLLLLAAAVVVLVVSVPSPPGSAVDVPRRLTDTMRRQSVDRQVGSE